MNKKHLKWLLSIIASFTIVCLVLGFLFSKTDREMVNGLTDTFDVNDEGVIAYVAHESGQPGIYLKTKNEEERVIQLSIDQEIMDIAFSPNQTTLLYSVLEGETSTVYTMDIHSLDVSEVFSDDSYVTELAFQPENPNQFFYLRAGVFKNYSPIAREYPHEYDLFHYDMKTDTEKQYTHLEQYEMQSLQIAEDGKTAYVQMVDDNAVETPEDAFMTKEKIFEIPLDDPASIHLYDKNIDAKVISDFALIPGEKEIIYQAVSNMEAGGTFEYELYHFDSETATSERITNLESYAGKPTITNGEETIYFIVNKNFDGRDDDNYLYKMKLNGSGVTEIPIGYGE